ncbi:MAG: extracellular solute-binding protein, partial [Clostridia bacterium]
MKKVVSILLILFMLIPAFAMADVSGLEGKIDAITAYIGEPITLQMMVFGATEVYEKINEKLMELYPEIAEKVKIEVVLGGSGDFDVAQKLRLSLAASETLPDIVRLNYTQLAEFAEAEILMDITDYIKPYEDNIIEGAKQLMQYDGTYYAF